MDTRSNAGRKVASVLGLAAAALVVAAIAAPAAAQTTCATPTLGCWKQLPNPEVLAVNAVALKTGKTLVVNQGLNAQGQQPYQLFDPVTDTFSPSPPAVTTVAHGLYCSGFDQVGESGDVLFAGGLTGVHLKHATIYHPATDTWSAQPDMVASRFYPTVVTVSRRDDLAIDGNGASANIPERFRIRFGDWESLFHAEYGVSQPPPNDFELPNYPRFHVLSTGELIYTGARNAAADFTRLLDPLFETWRTPFDTPDAINGTSGVMYDSDTILKAGPTQTWTLQATTPNAVWEQRA
ncbi:MAG: kelch repeat-containing protein, partial [Chloroflexi bacterium]|nr:kelch repeat-containing protein [Chloroflexota bacterium]